MTWVQRRVVVLRDNRTSGMRLRMVDLVRRIGELPVCARHRERCAARHDAALPALRDREEQLVDRLNVEGVASRQVRMNCAARHEIARAIEELKTAATDQPVAHLPLDRPDTVESLYRWGLAEANLDIAERLIGQPVRYLGLEVKVERVRTAQGMQQARQWHLDAEDHRMLKIIIYLNDVDCGTGPFQYLPVAASATARRALRCRPGITFLTDDAVAAVSPRMGWRQATGTAGTAVYADTGRVIHRLKAPTRQDRYSVTFVYTSDRPYAVFTRFMPPRALIEAVAATSTPRQRRALPDRDWLRFQQPGTATSPSDHLALSESAS
ncbi:hypothetical protein ACWDUN_28925 [Mycobacterium sp. NPDC003323]